MWDADIHLLSVTTQTEVSGQKSEVRESFRYDALHRRVARLESSTNTTTYFVMDGWNVIAEYSSTAVAAVSVPGVPPGAPGAAAAATGQRPATQSGATPDLRPAVRHVWGEDPSRTLQGAGGIGGLLSSTHFPVPNNGSTTVQPSLNNRSTFFFSYDSNGNVILLTDSSCLTAAKYRYDAFGRAISATGNAANLNRYRFSTKPVESASGLAFYGYRYYDPVMGRWPSRDPVEERGGINLYGMASNNPLTKIDFLGQSEIPIGFSTLHWMAQQFQSLCFGTRIGWICDACCEMIFVLRTVLAVTEAALGVEAAAALCAGSFGLGCVFGIVGGVTAVGDAIQNLMNNFNDVESCKSQCLDRCHGPFSLG